MPVVLDASAIIAFLRDEPGAQVVADHLRDERQRSFAHALNLCEVYYDFSAQTAGARPKLRWMTCWRWEYRKGTTWNPISGGQWDGSKLFIDVCLSPTAAPWRWQAGSELF